MYVQTGWEVSTEGASVFGASVLMLMSYSDLIDTWWTAADNLIKLVRQGYLLSPLGGTEEQDPKMLANIAFSVVFCGCQFNSRPCRHSSTLGPSFPELPL